MKRLLVLTVFFAILLSIFAGCEDPRDPNVLYEDSLSNELKEEISDLFFGNLRQEYIGRMLILTTGVCITGP